MKIQTTQAIFKPKQVIQDCNCKTCGYSHPSGIEMDYHYMFHRDHICPRDIREWRDSSKWHPRLSQVVRDILHDHACIWLDKELEKLEQEEIAPYKLNLMLKQSGRIL